MGNDFKLIKILKELKEDVHGEPVVKFTMPSSIQQKRADVSSSNNKGGNFYTSKSDFTKFNKSISSNNSPSFEEYRKHFIEFEGKKNVPYRDTRGFPTVGIGHKFEKGEKIKSRYTDAEVDSFFKQDLNEAIGIAKRVFPNFENLPKEVKIKLVSLSFNLGEGGIRKFEKFRSAVTRNDWRRAAAELKDSRWYSQVGRRAREYVKFFNSLA